MRTIVVSDVHGCLAELQELLVKLRVCRGEDRLIFVGDVVDRGPDSIGCMRLVQGLGAECLLGNHEEKYLRWHRFEQVRRATGKRNPMTSMTAQKRALYARMDEFDFEWLASLPLYIELGEHAGQEWIAVHGGFEPVKPLEKQDPRKAIRCRWVNAAGEYLPISMGTKMINGRPALKKPKGAIRWTSSWKGPERVVYGHAVRNLEEPTCEGNTVGIDTGCVFGGRLTALVLDPQNVEVVQVKSRRTYAKVLVDAA